MTDQRAGPPEDDMLAEAFSDLRDATRAGAPSFEHVLQRRRPPTDRLRWLAMAATVAIMAGSGWWFGIRPGYPTIPDTYNVARWDAPTDFLLDSRSRDWFGAVPVFGLPRSTQPEPDQPTPTNDSSVKRRIQS